MAFTFFFRDMHTIDHMAKILIPEVSGRSRIRIWDAGCAMGPEPYTLAMILAEAMGQFSFKNLYITATDIDEQDAFGKIIIDGVYSDEETKRIPPEIFAKYFEVQPSDPPTFKVISAIRERIQFQKHNLLTLQPVGSGFSLILCKNVLLHFQPAERIEVLKMFHSSLATGGLFATENTQKIPGEINHMFNQVIPDVQLFRKVEQV
ncbi:MAG: CheR family methyltransferase [Ignavibacteriaceae bacterium]|jgi:chemotaxis protein methyltransferase CheR